LQIYNKEDIKLQEQPYKGLLTNPIKDKPLVCTANTCCAQVLRSSADWSIGFSEDIFECSIYNAYIHYIGKAEHYVYIENQFFVSAYNTIDCPVKNRIADALFSRILIAHKNNEQFKVFLFAPLYPSSPGDIVDDSNSAKLRQIYYHEQLTLGYKKGSLMQRLIAEGINPFDYIQVLGLRNHANAKGKPMTELIYIHSKVLIVDDKYAIIGSANVNDRSMLGYRDSELAVIITDNMKRLSKMNGEKYEARGFAHRLRTKLMIVSFIGTSIGTLWNDYARARRSCIRKVVECNKRKSKEEY
jgi:phospholipase D1/2